MKVCVIGCGAIGSIYGSHLAMHDDIDVWAYDLNSEHVDMINQNGLKLTGQKERVVKVTATTNPDEIPQCGLGIIATKIYHTRAAIESTAHLFQSGVVCSLQNGIRNEEIIAEYVKSVISGSTLAGGHISSPGVVNFDTNETTWIGPHQNSVSLKQVQHLADLLSKNGLNTEVIEDCREMKWSKLIFNAAANPLCALTGLPFGDMYRQPELKKLAHSIAHEGLSVANKLDIKLGVDPVVEMMDKASESASSHIPSMLTDVLNRQKTEIDALNGSIAFYGSKVDIACPSNRAIVALIKGLESSWGV